MALLRHFISIRRGLSHIEILIAISILSLSIVGSIHITFASKRILNKGELYQELKSRALSALLVEKEKLSQVLTRGSLKQARESLFNYKL